MQRLLSKRNKKIKLIAIYIVSIILLFVFLVPIYWIVALSFQEPVDILRMPPSFIFKPTLRNYKVVLNLQSKEEKKPGGWVPSSADFLKNIKNSVIIVSISTLIVLIIGTPAAYSLARFRFRGKRHFSFFVLSVRILPPVCVIIPFFILFGRLHLIDTHAGLIIMYILYTLPLMIWVMKGFFMELPVETEEAARLDGCNWVQSFLKITLPLAAPGLAATVILCTFFIWNEFLTAVILTSNVAKTAPVGVSSFMSDREIAWGVIAAASVLVILPMITFVAIVQKNLVRGITAGAFKA